MRVSCLCLACRCALVGMGGWVRGAGEEGGARVLCVRGAREAVERDLDVELDVGNERL